MGKITNRQISAKLDAAGITHSRAGYVYLMTGIRMILDEEVDRSLMLEIEKKIAEKHNTKAITVNSAIRNSVLNSKKQNMKSKEFIARIIDELIFDDEEAAI